jgi:site-specific recombinase XerD
MLRRRSSRVAKSTSGNNLLAPTVSKYRTAIERLLDWCDESGYTSMAEITKPVLIAYKDAWAE